MRAGEVNAAMGLRAMGVDLVNCGTGTITLNGYPGVRLSGADGRRIKFSLKHGVRAVAMIEEWEKAPEKVTLRPGESAVSLLVWRNITEATPEGPATATGLEMAAADGQPPYQPVPMQSTIDLGTTAKLAVSPWRRNDRGDRPVPTTDPSVAPLA
jgi:hypothetical protein